MADKQLIKGRRNARKLALQALYQRLLSNAPVTDVEAEFKAIHPADKADFDYFSKLIHGVTDTESKLDDVIAPLLDRKLEDINPIELVILRLGTYELTEVRETPYRVILDESINLAKTFGSKDGHRYVNGILHALAKQLRAGEIDVT